VSLVHTRLDCGSFVLVGLPAYQQRHFESVLNAATRLVYRLRRYDNITDALATLHWLRLPERVDFKVTVAAFRVLRSWPRSTVFESSGSRTSLTVWGQIYKKNLKTNVG